MVSQSTNRCIGLIQQQRTLPTRQKHPGEHVNKHKLSSSKERDRLYLIEFPLDVN